MFSVDECDPLRKQTSPSAAKPMPSLTLTRLPGTQATRRAFSPVTHEEVDDVSSFRR